MRSRPTSMPARRVVRGRLNPLARAAAALCLMGSPLWLQAASALPTGMQAVHGQASVSVQGTQMTVRNTPGAILNWQSFSIGAGNGVYFDQASAASKVLNRVTGNDPSLIFGSLASNGQVWLLNPNGVLFGAGARIDVAGLVASTLRLNDNDFVSGRYRFNSDDRTGAAVRNEGALTSSFGGQIVLLGERVENAGDISAPGGQVTLAAARSVELVDTGLPNLAVRVNVPAGEALNLGRLAAAGGTVDVYAAIVNQQGLIQADAMSVDATGRVLLQASETIHLAAGSRTQADGAAGGQVVVDAGAGSLLSEGVVSAQGSQGSGGRIDLLGRQVAVSGQAVVDASGASGGGRIRFGGGAEGKDTSVANANAIFFGNEATMRADATGAFGDGGNIVLWSDAATRAYGHFSARGGAIGGAGGFLETSGGWLDARPASVALSAAPDRAGRWLLDPNNILINNTGPDTNITGGPNFTSTDDSSVISTATLAAALNAGVSVTVATGNGGTNSQAGDIVMNAATLNVSPTATVTLTLQAARDISVRDSTITSTGQSLSLDFVAAGSGVGVIELVRSNITTAGGSLSLRGANAIQVPLPGGGVTSGTYAVTVAHGAGDALTELGSIDGVVLKDSAVNLGSGQFLARGFSSLSSNGIGVFLDNSTVQTGAADIIGFSTTLNTGEPGVALSHASVVSSGGVQIQGFGPLGMQIADGAVISATGSGSISLAGSGTNGGVVIREDADTPGTQVVVATGNISIDGATSSTGFGVEVSNTGTATAGPVIAATNGGTLTMLDSSSAGGGLYIHNVNLVGPNGASGTTTLRSNNGLVLVELAGITAGGALTLDGTGVSLSTSTLLAAAGAALNTNFVTAVGTPQGVSLNDSGITTGGGDVRFGADQIVCSTPLGCTGVAAPWVEVNGFGNTAALSINNTTIDAGAGRVHGGGAVRSGNSNVAGVELVSSSITAREISLAGRSDSASAIVVNGGNYLASRIFALDALSAASESAALEVGPGTTLQLVDPTSDSASQMTLRGNNRGDWDGIFIRGGLLGTSGETHINVSGAALLLDGITTGGSGYGLYMASDPDLPGGLIFSMPGATAATLRGFNESGDGNGLLIRDTQIQGPQATATLQIVGSAVNGDGGPGSRIEGSSISSGGVIHVVGDGLIIDGSIIAGDRGVVLQSNTGSGAPVGVPILVQGSTLRTSADGAEIRIEGTQGDAVRGSGDFSPVGILIDSSQLIGTGAGSRIQLNGQGADSGGTGVVLTRATLTASDVVIRGRGVIDGDGVYAEDGDGSTTTLNATNLDISGFSADADPANATHAGVHLGAGVVLNLGGGTTTIGGDTVVLGNASSSFDAFTATGSPNVFEVLTTGAQRIVNAQLDFGDAATTINLLADTDSSGGGRVRIEASQIFSGGGNITIRGVGNTPDDAQGNLLPINSTIAEGASGVLFSGDAVIDASAGSVIVNGRGATLMSATSAGAWGIYASGTNSISGNSITLDGHGGTRGIGIDIGFSNSGSTLDLSGNTVTLTGTGSGVDSFGDAYQGIVVDGQSTWEATNDGSLTVTSLAGALSLTSLSMLGDTVLLTASNGPLDIVAASIVSTGALSATASGAAVNGALFSIANSTLAAGGALTLQANATSGGAGLFLNTGVTIVGNSVTLTGTGAGEPGLFFVSLGGGQITATGGDLVLTGREPSGSEPGIRIEGPWILGSPSALRLNFDNSLLLSDADGDTLPSLGSGGLVALSLNRSGVATLGNAGTDLDMVTLGAVLAGNPASTTTEIRIENAAGAMVQEPFSVAGRFRLLADDLTLASTAHFSAGGSGDAVVLAGANAAEIGNFVNNAGTTVFDVPAGRWVLRLASPQQAQLGGLQGAFTAYNLGAVPWTTDAQGNLITPAPGNAIGFAVAPSDITGGPLGGLLTKVYDASTGILLDPDSWVLTGLLPGDGITIGGVTLAQMLDKNVGSGKAVILDPGSVFSFTDANGNPVFGYSLPVFTATVTPRDVLLTGAVVANKVYDGTTAATLAAIGSVIPLASDVLGVGGTVTATFSDKNVGNGKAVAVGGFALTGADAGNYTLIAPASLTADITPLALSITGLVANNRVYDATLLATLTGTAAISPVSGDAVVIAGTASASFADKNVGIAKPVSVTGLSLTGADAGNYTLLAPSGLSADITPAALLVSGLAAAGKVYDGNTVAALTGTAAIAPLGSDALVLTGTASGSFADKNVGAAKPVAVTGLTLGGTDAGNYTLVAPASLTADITPATITLSAVVAANKVYDGTTAATATGTTAGQLAGDNVNLGMTALFADRNVGIGKAVSYSAALSGSDAGNYVLAGGSGSTTANITPATLTYTAVPLSISAGAVLPTLTGALSGFVVGDTQANSTTGAPVWTTPATPASPAGNYAINGGGLTALNYQFVQDPANATALTLTPAAQNDFTTTATTVAINSALFSVQLPVTMSTPVFGRVLDVMPALFSVSDQDGGGVSFRAVNLSQLTRDEVESLLAARAAYKAKIFGNGLHKLELDPALADVRACRNEAELGSGACIATAQLRQEIEAANRAATPRLLPQHVMARKIKQATLPTIQRKVALLIGVNKYEDKRVPELVGAVPDARAVRDLLEARLGYETTVLENPSRASIIKAFNKLAQETEAGDSVIVYYAGHGVVVPVNGVDTGFWLPADVDAELPQSWLSNADIARMVAAVGSKQLMLVSDSCYSGTLVGNQRVQVSQTTDAGDLLSRRAAVIMSSGGNEPVADEGRDGHSLFAWHFMRSLEDLSAWQIGGNVFDRVRAAVSREFPQTPQYGASVAAGHQGNTDYLFERRELDKAP